MRKTTRYHAIDNSPLSPDVAPIALKTASEAGTQSRRGAEGRARLTLANHRQFAPRRPCDRLLVAPGAVLDRPQPSLEERLGSACRESWQLQVRGLCVGC